MPWFACLFVNETHRKKGYAEMFLNHGLQQSKLKGFDNLYLSTDLVNFYERKGWSELGKGFNFSGEEIKIYIKPT
jgi:GNAT superfamily N-acetyltransferase